VKDLTQKHNGNPAWHPSGEYILFQSEMESHIGSSKFSEPGSGLWCNLYLMTSDGKKFWKLTDYSSGGEGRGVLHPHFSPDGKRILWAERVGNLKGAKQDWGEWALKVADLIFDKDQNPHLENIKTFQPAEQPAFLETHGFSPDSRKIIFCSNIKKGQHCTGIDICTLELETGKLENLTDSFFDWDEHAHFSPDGKRIVWMCSAGYKFTADSLKSVSKETDVHTDLWMMDADGKNKRRLTYFNEKGHPEYIGHTICADNCWRPDGKAIAVLILNVKTSAWLIVFIELY